MGLLDALWHLLNLFAAPLGVGVIAAVAAKLLWRRELAGVPLRRLAALGCGAAAVATLGGLIWFGRDGRIGTYVALVVACALALWWAGFGPGRR
jgi:hypothetical protein